MKEESERVYCVTAYSVCTPRTSFAGNGGEASGHSGISSSDQLLADVPVLVKKISKSGEGVNRREKENQKGDHEPGTNLWGKRSLNTTLTSD